MQQMLLKQAAQLPTMQQMLLKHRRLHVVDLSMRSLNGSRSSNSPAYVGETTFDTNMVIILAALLCALIGALGVNSIVRCAMRCRRSFAAESAEEAAAREAVAGLEKKELGRIPVVVYGGGGSIKGTECPICLSEFEDGDKVRILPKCNHGFHVKCIDTWLVSHSSCPNCRHSLFEQPSDSSQQLGGSPSTQQRSSISAVIDGSGTN